MNVIVRRKRCIECSEKDPCITVYHGTSVNSVSSIRRDGMENVFVTTSPYRAHWFGSDYGRPVLLKIRTPLSKLRKTDQDRLDEYRVKYIFEMLEERTAAEGFDDLYLFIRGKIKPCQITILPRKEMVLRVAREELKEGMLGDQLTRE